MKANKTMYRLTIGDIQTVARDTLERDLSDSEVRAVAERIGDTLNWYDPIWFAIMELEKKGSMTKSTVA